MRPYCKVAFKILPLSISWMRGVVVIQTNVHVLDT